MSFSSVDGDTKRNTEFSKNDEGVPGENWANFAKREILHCNANFPGPKRMGI